MAVEKRIYRDGEEECFLKHERWFEDTLTPKIRWVILTMLGSAVVIATSVVFYVSQNVVREHEITETKEYVSKVEHEKDLQRIEIRMDKLENNISSTMQNLSDKIDRSMLEIKSSQRRVGPTGSLVPGWNYDTRLTTEFVGKPTSSKDDGSRVQ